MLRRGEADRTEVVICHRASEDLWALPKGTPDGEETALETARREVQEETGLQIRADRPLDTIGYSFVRQAGDRHRYPHLRSGEEIRFDKVVHFFLMTATGGDVSLHDSEFDDVRWIEAGAARRRLTHENEARILEKAVALFEGSATGETDAATRR